MISPRKIRIAGSKYDLRVKLSPMQKEAILLLSREHQYSQRKLAAIFGVSKRRIQNLITPEIRVKGAKVDNSLASKRSKACQERKLKLFREGLLELK